MYTHICIQLRKRINSQTIVKHVTPSTTRSRTSSTSNALIYVHMYLCPHLGIWANLPFAHKVNLQCKNRFLINVTVTPKIMSPGLPTHCFVWISFIRHQFWCMKGMHYSYIFTQIHIYILCECVCVCVCTCYTLQILSTLAFVRRTSKKKNTAKIKTKALHS